MTPFEYVIVLNSIILGMGIAQIITGVSDLVHHWHRAKIYLPHLVWVLLIFFLDIQDWWSTYELRHSDVFRLSTFLFILLYPINLFILARILFPVIREGENIDLKKFYLESYRKFFGWAATLPVLSFLQNVALTGHPIQSQVVQIALFVLLLGLMLIRRLAEWVHVAFALFLLSVMVIVLLYMWDDLLII